MGDAAGDARGRRPRAAALPGVRLRGVSRLYATDPVGVLDQPEFRNAVVALDVPGGPDPATGASALLVALKGLERAFGRQARERWGPRELDLDLLVFGRHRIDVERPPEGRSDDPAKAALPLDVPHSRRATGCSCSRRSPTWRRDSCRPAGVRPSRRPRDRRAAAEGAEPSARSAVGRRWLAAAQPG